MPVTRVIFWMSSMQVFIIPSSTSLIWLTEDTSTLGHSANAMKPSPPIFSQISSQRWGVNGVIILTCVSRTLHST